MNARGSNDRICPRCNRVQSRSNRACSGCGEPLCCGFGKRADRRAASFLPPAFLTALDAAPAPSRVRVGGQASLLALMVWATWAYAWASIDRSQRALSLPHHLLESANLVFHEAGHWIFGVLGIDLLTIGGGSLMQLLIPAICALAFLTRYPDPFAGAFATWWAGQSAVDVAPYVADARAQRLVLLGGITGRDRPGYHDWNNLLGRLGLLEWDAALGGLAHWGGLAVMTAAIAIAAAVLRMQWHRAAPELATAPHSATDEAYRAVGAPRSKA